MNKHCYLPLGLLALVLVPLRPLSAAPIQMPAWSQAPLETQSATRATICLNGLWKFMPASGPAATVPNNDWGWLRVPGAWCGSGWPPLLRHMRLLR